jgi:hypothetical protein
MPSIPQSLLWISLVVLWLFVLVPMLINKRETVRRTSDVALATRVLGSDAKARLVRRRGPATGHRHDPDWQRDDDPTDEHDEVEEYDEAVRAARAGVRTRAMSVMVVATSGRSALLEEDLTEPVYLDVDVVDENSGALPVGSNGQESLFATDPPTPEESGARAFVGSEPSVESAFSEDTIGESDPIGEPEGRDDPRDGLDDEYEYIDDTSGLETEAIAEGAWAPGDERADGPGGVIGESRTSASRPGNRQRRLETTTTAAAVSARKYRFRTRVLITMSAIMVASAVASFTLNAAFWWVGGATATVTVLYLAYLRRQTRIEAQVRRRRQQRMARTRPMERAPEWRVDYQPQGEEFPARLRRPGAAVLDIDDEDPVFEHLDEVAYSRRYDLPRAAGQ